MKCCIGITVVSITISNVYKHTHNIVSSQFGCYNHRVCSESTFINMTQTEEQCCVNLDGASVNVYTVGRSDEGCSQCTGHHSLFVCVYICVYVCVCVCVHVYVCVCVFVCVSNPVLFDSVLMCTTRSSMHLIQKSYKN